MDVGVALCDGDNCKFDLDSPKFVPPGTKLPEKYEPTHKISFLRCTLVHCQWTNVTLCSLKVISRHHDKNESL